MSPNAQYKADKNWSKDLDRPENNDDDSEGDQETQAAERGSAIAERDRNLRAIQMADLCSQRRNDITSTDMGARAPTVPLRSILAQRAVNEAGSKQAKAFMQNKGKIAGWNNLHTTLGIQDVEQLDTMMDGQSHRSRLNISIRGDGNQLQAGPNSRGGPPARGGRGGGVMGTRGRGGPSFKQYSVSELHVYRPLDPAVQRDAEEYVYKSSRGSRNARSAYLGNQSSSRTIRGAKPSNIIGDRSRVNSHFRGALVGNTVHLSATTPTGRIAHSTIPDVKKTDAKTMIASVKFVSSAGPKTALTETGEKVHNSIITSKPYLQPLLPPPPPKKTTHHYDALLDPQAFMAAVAKTKDRELFNQQVPPIAKPAPASKAKEVSNIAAAKVANGGTKSSTKVTKPTPECQAAQLKQAIQQTTREIRRVPTHEFSFPPPFSSSTPPAPGEVSSWTDGIPSHESSDSGEISPTRTPIVELANATRVTDPSDAAETLGPVDLPTPLAVAGSKVLGASSLAAGPSNVDGQDLVMLENECNNSESVAGLPSGRRSEHDPNVNEDLMDLNFDDIDQSTLTPSPPLPKPVGVQEPESTYPSATGKEHPPYLVYHGIRYMPVAEQSQNVANAHNGSESQSQTTVLAPVPTSSARAIVANGYTIGLGNLLGDHNLPGRAQTNHLAQTTQTSVDAVQSSWAIHSQADRQRARGGQTRPPVAVAVDHQMINPSQPVHVTFSRNARPTGIGEQNLPGRSQISPPHTDQPPATKASSLAASIVQRSTQQPSGKIMPLEANPFGRNDCSSSVPHRSLSSRSSIVTAQLNTTQTGSNSSVWPEPAARMISPRRHMQSTIPEGPSVSPEVGDLSDIGCFNGSAHRGAVLRVRNSDGSYTYAKSAKSEASVVSDFDNDQPIVRLPSQPPASPSPQQEPQAPTIPVETLDEKIVRMTKNTGPMGMTPFAGSVAGATAVSSSPRRQDSTALAGGSRDSSQSTVGQSRTNLTASKWSEVQTASGEANASKSKWAPLEVSPGLKNKRVPTAKESVKTVRDPRGGMSTTTTRISGGPGFKMLQADLKALGSDLAVPDVPLHHTEEHQTSNVNRAQAQTAVPPLHRTRDRQALNHNQAPVPTSVQAEPVIRRGRGSFKENSSRNYFGRTSSTESEL